jgi:lysozyme
MAPNTKPPAAPPKPASGATPPKPASGAANPILASVTIAELAGALIATFEGERLTAYRDSGGVLTIGFGHTGKDVTEGRVITHAQAVFLLQQDAAPLFQLVAHLPVAHAAALVSFGYNCGRSRMEAVLAGHDTIANPVHTTDRQGHVLPGLVARRRLEETLSAL